MRNNNIKFKILVFIILLSTSYFLFSISVFAAELTFKKNSEDIGKEDVFDISLVINTEEEAINAIEANLKYSNNLKLENISDGNSVMNLWIRKPTIDNSKNGDIFLSGLIPGGLTIKEGTILTFTFRNLSEGKGYLSVRDAKILRNDTEASEAKIGFKNLEFNIGSEKTKTRTGEKLILDFLPPDEFKIYLSKDKNAFSNNWFISFNAQDKGSGINYHEIREKFLGFWGSWKIDESPYPLSDQLLLSIIEVRAVDNIGRERIATFVPIRLYVFYIILVGLVISILLFRIFKHLKNKHKKGGI